MRRFTPRFPTGSYVLNRQSPQAKNLLAWWPTLGGNGIHLPELSNGINATYTSGNPTWSRSANYGTAVSFDGTTDNYFDAGTDTRLNFTADFSLSFWVRLLSGHAVNDVLLCRGVWGTGGYYVQTVSGSPYKMAFYINQPTGIKFQSASDISEDIWYHIAITRRGGSPGDTSIYINGVLDITTSTVNNPTSVPGYTFYIGRYDTTSFEPVCDMADIRAYNRTLNSGEVARIYNPLTRWDLYKPVMTRRNFVAPAAAAITGPLIGGKLVKSGPLIKGRLV